MELKERLTQIVGKEFEPHVNGYGYTPKEIWNPRLSGRLPTCSLTTEYGNLLLTVLLDPSPCSSELASRGDIISKSRIKPVRKRVIRGIAC